ncbi:hypothetical protein NQ318_018489, partial [Aromia moschata]
RGHVSKKRTIGYKRGSEGETRFEVGRKGFKYPQEDFQSHPTNHNLLTSPQRGKFSGGYVGDGMSHLALNRPFTVGPVNIKSLQARIDKRKAWILKQRIRKPVSKFMRVCSLHFAEEDYFYRSKDFKKRKILKNTAVPLNS